MIPDYSYASIGADGAEVLLQCGHLQLTVEVAGVDVLLQHGYLQLTVEVVAVGAEALLWGEYLAPGTEVWHGYHQLAVEVVGTEALLLGD